MTSFKYTEDDISQISVLQLLINLGPPATGALVQDLAMQNREILAPSEAHPEGRRKKGRRPLPLVLYLWCHPSF